MIRRIILITIATNDHPEVLICASKTFEHKALSGIAASFENTLSPNIRKKKVKKYTFVKPLMCLIKKENRQINEQAVIILIMYFYSMIHESY